MILKPEWGRILGLYFREKLSLYTSFSLFGELLFYDLNFGICFSLLSKLDSSYRMWLCQGFLLALLSITKVDTKRRKIIPLLGFSVRCGQTWWCGSTVMNLVKVPVPHLSPSLPNVQPTSSKSGDSTRQGMLGLFIHSEMIFWGFSGLSINLVSFFK